MGNLTNLCERYAGGEMTLDELRDAVQPEVKGADPPSGKGMVTT